jgi:hypothetical protein
MTANDFVVVSTLASRVDISLSENTILRIGALPMIETTRLKMDTTH